MSDVTAGGRAAAEEVVGRERGDRPAEDHRIGHRPGPSRRGGRRGRRDDRRRRRPAHDHPPPPELDRAHGRCRWRAVGNGAGGSLHLDDIGAARHEPPVEPAVPEEGVGARSELAGSEGARAHQGAIRSEDTHDDAVHVALVHPGDAEAIVGAVAVGRQHPRAAVVQAQRGDPGVDPRGVDRAPGSDVRLAVPEGGDPATHLERVDRAPLPDGTGNLVPRVPIADAGAANDLQRIARMEPGHDGCIRRWRGAEPQAIGDHAGKPAHDDRPPRGGQAGWQRGPGRDIAVDIGPSHAECVPVAVGSEEDRARARRRAEPCPPCAAISRHLDVVPADRAVVV